MISDRRPSLQPEFQAEPPLAPSCAQLYDEEIDATEEFDHHGFAMLPVGDTVGDVLREYAEEFEPKAQRRLGRFELRRGRLPDAGAWHTLPKKTLKAILRKGLPHEHRKEVWCAVLGVEERRKAATRSYTELLGRSRKDLSLKTSEEIEKDLQRTFPNHRKFRSAVGQAELRNVLSAHALHSPRIQYCQGLNFIAALLLIVLGEEELAFWALVCAVETLGVERYYTEGMTLLRADMSTLGELLRRKVPKVARRLAALGIDLTSVCPEWFITWYGKCLPVSTTLRVWDTLFFEGFKVLFRVAVGIFKLVEPDILRCNCFEDIMEQVKDWPRRMVRHNDLLKASFHGVPGLRRRDILKVRDDALCRVEREELRAREAREQAEKDQLAKQAMDAKVRQAAASRAALDADRAADEPLDAAAYGGARADAKQPPAAAGGAAPAPAAVAAVAQGRVSHL